MGDAEVRTVRLGGMQTESGFDFPELDVAYLTLGSPSASGDNAVLIFHALSGNAQVAGQNARTGRPGWWDFHVGPGKTIDTDHFFVICANILGGCDGSTGPSSVNPSTGRRYGVEFPLITIRDMVRAQILLLDHLGIKQVFCAIGGSMGGMQALTMSIDYPDRVRTCIPIATCMAQNAMQIAFGEVARQAILTDPNWTNGDYTAERRPEHGLAVARMMAHITYLSKHGMEEKFGRRLQRPAEPGGIPFPQYQIESYLMHQGGNFVKRFDPNSYLYITKAMNMYEMLDGRRAADVLAAVRARFLVVSFESDWLYTPQMARELVRTLKRAHIRVTYANLETPYGHDSFLIRNPDFTRIVSTFMRREYQAAHEPHLQASPQDSTRVPDSPL